MRGEEKRPPWGATRVEADVGATWVRGRVGTCACDGTGGVVSGDN
jgi:hypothetical protein